MPKFLIHIIGLNRLDMTKKCVESVLNHSLDYSLVLTNNGSNDGTGDYFYDLQKQYRTGSDHIVVVDNDDNQGFIGPNNHAFEIAQQRGIPYYIALNNDTEVPSGWLDMLADPLDRDGNGALSGPQGTCCSLHDNMHGHPGPRYEYVEGSCLCAKVSIVGQYGPLFSNYLDFIYGDDSDLSLRMREKGHNIYRVPFMLKHTQGSTVEHSPEVKARCKQAQEHNHEILLKRWAHYLKVRKFDYPIIIRRKYALGDVLLVTPIVAALKKSNPMSPVFVETEAAELFRHHPHVCAAARDLMTDPDDLVINLDMAYENRQETHIVGAYAEVACQVVPGLGPVEKKTFIYPGEADKKWATNLLAVHEGHRICAMHMGPTDWPGKNWNENLFFTLMHQLMTKGWKIILAGSKQMPITPRSDLFNLTGKTSPLQLAALLQQAHLFIGIDSFPLHAAQAAGCPAIGLFGVTQSKYILTEGSRAIGIDADPKIPCAGLRHRETGQTYIKCSSDCIDSISVDQVMAAVERLTK